MDPVTAPSDSNLGCLKDASTHKVLVDAGESLYCHEWVGGWDSWSATTVMRVVRVTLT